jgi:hypothetical protein
MSKIYYVIQDIDYGKQSHCRITWEGPFGFEANALAALERLKILQPQFDFIIEVEDESGKMTTR